MVSHLRVYLDSTERRPVSPVRPNSVWGQSEKARSQYNVEMSRFEQVGIFVKDTVSTFVDQPEAVKVTMIRQADSILYGLAVSPKDIDKVTGKGVRTEHSLRIILSIIGTKMTQTLLLELTP